ncbi:MAG: type I secretion C-terminal target domain-containing protein [Chakrabartia sp.]
MATSSKTGKTISGPKSAEIWNGTTSNDALFASTSNEILRGGAGDDVLTGGLGNDTFLFEVTHAANGVDTITDFLPLSALDSGDLLDLSLVLNSKNISGKNVGQYVWVVNSTLYVDPTGQHLQSADTAFAHFLQDPSLSVGGAVPVLGDQTAQGLAYLVAGDQLYVRTQSFDGYIRVGTPTNLFTPAIADSSDYVSASDPLSFSVDQQDLVTNDIDLSCLPADLGALFYSIDGGQWTNSYPAIGTLAEGAHSLAIRQILPDGGVVTQVPIINFVLDTKADPDGTLQVSFDDGGKDISYDATDATLTVSGIALDVRAPDAAGQNKVSVSISDGTTSQDAVWDYAHGNWHFDPSQFASGASLTATVREVDKAGNSATATDVTKLTTEGYVLTQGSVTHIYGFDPKTAVVTVMGHSIADPTGPMVSISAGSAYYDSATITGSGNVLIIRSDSATISDPTFTGIPNHEYGSVFSLASWHFPNTIGSSWFTNTLVIYTNDTATADAAIYDITQMGSAGATWQLELVGVIHGVGADSLSASNFG